MRHTALLVFLCALCTSASYAQQRELGAHVHGESQLTMAVESETIAMELEAPAMDIVGFEHEASTDEQKASLESARKSLSDPLSLFVIPEAAGCTVTEAQVEHQFGEDHEEEGHSEGEGHAAEGGHEEAAHSEGEDHAAEGGHAEEVHSHFHAEYRLSCHNPNAVTSLEFRFFELFAGAESIDVQVVSDKGQSSFEVKRDNPRLDLAASM